MKRKNILTSGLYLSTLILLFTACKRTDLSKLASTAWRPNLAIPIGKASFGVYDVLAKTDTTDLVVIDNTGALKLVYTNGLDILSAEDFVNLPDQSFTVSKMASDYGVAPTASFPMGAQFSFNINEVIDFTAGGSFQLFDIDFKNGKFYVSASTTLRHSVKFDFSFPDLLVNGIPATSTINLNNPNGIPPQTGSDTINLNNAIFNLDNGSQGYNQVRINATVTVTGSGNEITSAENISFGVGQNNMAFDIIHGDFGQQNVFNINDTIAIKIFNNFSQGQVQFTDPSIQFKVFNSFGIPMQIQFNEVKTKEDSTGTEYQLQGFPPFFNIAGAASPGNTATSSFTINDQNSQNINSIVSPTPKKLIYDVSGSINPAGPATNFVKDNSSVSLEGTLTLPLEGWAKNFSIKDTIKFELGVPQEIVGLNFRIIADNGFPIEVGTKISLMDSDYNVLAEITNGQTTIIQGAPVDINGKVIQSAKKITDIKLSDSDIEQLRNTKFIEIEAFGETFNGSQNQVVKLYDTYRIDIRLAALVIGKL